MLLSQKGTTLIYLLDSFASQKIFLLGTMPQFTGTSIVKLHFNSYSETLSAYTCRSRYELICDCC